MAMDDVAFGFLLSPHLLAERADSLTNVEIKGLLKTFLGLLHTEKARSTPATVATTPTAVAAGDGGVGGKAPAVKVLPSP